MKKKSQRILCALLWVTFSTALAARAEAPAVELNQELEIDQEGSVSSPHVAVSYQHEPLDQRILRLERQIANLNEMNYASKLEKIQQELQQLHGQIEMQDHDLAELKEQIRNFYQDLDQRLTKKGAAKEKEAQSMEEASSAPINATKPKELQTYEAAFNLLHKKQYDKAISEFQHFVTSYPTGAYTVNAHYWLGEIYYLKDQPDAATKEFQTIISHFPTHPKVADAILKIALIAMDAGNYSKARQHLLKVQKQFPGSTAAKVAALRLKEIKQKQ